MVRRRAKTGVVQLRGAFAVSRPVRYGPRGSVSGDGKRLAWSRTAANEGPEPETVSPSKGFTQQD
jgi:hypothetical protein